jgi:nucleotide-binding universal stress UspA family protein
MKTIFVPVGGTADDEAVFETAHALARLLLAHLSFCHIHIDAGEAALWTPHADFARGAGLRATLRRLTEDADSRSAAAERHVAALCGGQGIAITDAPASMASGAASISASWRRESSDALNRLMFHARHHDLVVLGRARAPNGLPPDFAAQLLLGCGRPLLIAGKRRPVALTGTVLVCWKEVAEAARAVSAAMPLLSRAGRVVVATVDEDDQDAASGLAELARLMTWHGIAAETELLPRNRRPIQETLADAARRHRADLMVMGGYGRSRARELILGGVTQSVLEDADLPVFLLH